MKVIGIFFGSDTGNTKKVAENIQKQIGKEICQIHDIAKCKREDFIKYNILLLGIPTWYYGEAQCDWNEFFPVLKTINLNGKSVALFGCGDQEDYTEYFCDALGIIYNIIKLRKATIVGFWPTKGYSFEASKGLLNDKYFFGLAIDEDRQPELTNNRIKKWVNQIRKELHLEEIIKKYSANNI